MTRKNVLKLVLKLLDKMPSWLVVTLCLLVTGVLTLYSLGMMGMLPFDLPGLDAMTAYTEPTQPPVSDSETAADTACQVHVIDVGQGDSILITTDEKAVLIDAGETQYGEQVVDYIKGLGISQLDLVIATHPHSDHIGGLGAVLAQVRTKELMMPELPENLIPTTSVYERMLDRMENHGIDGVIAEPGLTYDLGSGTTLTVLGPVAEAAAEGLYDNLNDYSVVCRVDCGERSFLFTGDMEVVAEDDLLQAGANLDADVMKMGHHGSSTSSGGLFLDAVSPSAAAISCGKDNDHGHPHREIRAELKDRQIPGYRTDLEGSILFSCDGKTITVETEKEG